MTRRPSYFSGLSFSQFAMLAICVIAVVSAIPSFSSHRRHVNQRGTSSEPGKFDYYLFNLSWEPEFCHSPRNQSSEECETSHKGFVVHGLWPQFNDGYPEHCSDAAGPTDPQKLLDVMPTTWLAQHEWTTHGTCSGLKADDYFNLIRKARGSINIPQKLSEPRERLTLSPSEIKALFAQSNPSLKTEDMAVSCGNNYLTAMEFCMSKDGLQPQACGESVNDCRASSVTVAPVR